MCKIAIYTVCKNEEKNINEWITNTKDADYIIVGDTGSTDNSIELLKDSKITVLNLQVSPWRFDEARNQVLSKIPEDTDICISLDLDERLSENFIAIIKNNYNKKYNRISYKIIENNEDGTIKSSTITSKIHSRNNFIWKYPVHENLLCINSQKENVLHLNDIAIYHKPILNKDRKNYLDLLKIACTENPTNFLFKYQLGIEYLKQNYIDKGLNVLLDIEDINLKEDEISTRLRMISRAYYLLGEKEKAFSLLKNIIDKFPYCNSNYVELIIMLYENKEYKKIIDMVPLLKNINKKYKSKFNEHFYQEWLLYDVISYSYSMQNDYEKALYYSKKALSLNSNNIRIKDNIKFFEFKKKELKNE